MGGGAPEDDVFDICDLAEDGLEHGDLSWDDGLEHDDLVGDDGPEHGDLADVKHGELVGDGPAPAGDILLKNIL